MANLSDIKKNLIRVNTISDFERWMRSDFRRVLPHAATLVTIGKLYGVGSVPTHRISADFPLGMVEELKNSSGSLDDPLMFGWFRNARLRFRDVEALDEFGEHERWRKTLLRYGIKTMMIHGVLDHTARKFATFQLCNVYRGGSTENVEIFSSLVKDMAEVIWRILGQQVVVRGKALFGHPTISLTETELHIIELLAQGLSNKEIARRRGVSDSTIKTQVQRTGAKVGATRRAEIVAMAMPILSPLPPQSLIDYDDDGV